VERKPRVWYTSGNFPDGYTYREDIIGHHVGTDGFDMFFELRLHPFGSSGGEDSPHDDEDNDSDGDSDNAGDDTILFLSYDYEEHFRHDPVEERLHQFRLGVRTRLWRRLWVTAFYQHDHWRNFRQREGDDETGDAIGLGARWVF
jgi:hypothetical protein